MKNSKTDTFHPDNKIPLSWLLGCVVYMVNRIALGILPSALMTQYPHFPSYGSKGCMRLGHQVERISDFYAENSSLTFPLTALRELGMLIGNGTGAISHPLSEILAIPSEIFRTQPLSFLFSGLMFLVWGLPTLAVARKLIPRIKNAWAALALSTLAMAAIASCVGVAVAVGTRGYFETEIKSLADSGCHLTDDPVKANPP